MDLLQKPARTVATAFLDLEMTGLDPSADRVCEVAVVRADGERVVAEYQALVRSDVRMSPGALRIHGISDAMLSDAPTFAAIAADVAELIDGAVLISHNVTHDLEFLHREFDRAGRPLRPPVAVDTLLMARRLFAFPKNHLQAVAERFGVGANGAHRALADARTTFEVWHGMLDVIDPDGHVTVGEILELLGALAPNSPLRLEQQRVLRDAFRHHRTVWIDYQSTEAGQIGLVHREIGIWHLKLPYIQAWCFLREGERVFRLDRIREVAEGERTYDIPTKFDPRI